MRVPGKSPKPSKADAAYEIIKGGLAAISFVGDRAVELYTAFFLKRREKRRNDLFIRAIALPAEEREAYLAKACAHDAALHEDLTSLVKAHDRADDYFDTLSMHVVAPTLSALGNQGDNPPRRDITDALRAKLAGTYHVVRELAGGGMSRVFLAEDLRLKREIVIKVLPPEMAPAAGVERFRREIEMAARLQHPHIVPVLATDSVDGMLYYTMPFVEGESLSERLAREEPLPLKDAVRIWREVLDALAYAHANGVVHLDVKPGNILLSGRHAVVTDFGISRAIETAAGDTLAALATGTPAYMAPEETGGARVVDPKVDIYSAGLVMYEMLAGKRPFVADSAGDYLLAHRKVKPAPIVRPDASQALLGLVMRCLAKDPQDRPQSAEAVLAQLDADGTVAGHSTAASNAARGPWQIAMAVVAVIALAAVLSLPLTHQRRPSDERTDADGESVSGPLPRTTTHIAAYEWYVRGMDVALLRNDEGRLQGVSYFKQAISIDSSYVEAYAGLVRMYVQLSNAADGAARQEWLDQARVAALTAVHLDGSDANARAALGWVHLLSRDYPSAETEFVGALALDMGVPRGHEGLARVYMMIGRPAEQLAEARLGLDADPFSHSAIRELGLAMATNGRCEESLESLEALKVLSPPAGVAGVLRGQCFASREMWSEAIEEFRWADAHSATAGLAFLGYSLARAGETDEAATILSDMLAGRSYSHGSWGIAVVYAGMHDYDRAFEWFNKAVDDGTMNFYIMHPVFDDLHRDPRFVDLKRRMLSDQSAAAPGSRDS